MQVSKGEIFWLCPPSTDMSFQYGTIENIDVCAHQWECSTVRVGQVFTQPQVTMSGKTCPKCHLSLQISKFILLVCPLRNRGLEAGQLYHALEQQKLLRRAEGAVLPTQRLPVLQALPQGHPHQSQPLHQGADTASCIRFMVSFSLLISSKKLSTWSIFPIIKWTSVNFLWFTSKRKHDSGEPS